MTISRRTGKQRLQNIFLQILYHRYLEIYIYNSIFKVDCLEKQTNKQTNKKDF